jgi:hypothetical protein
MSSSVVLQTSLSSLPVRRGKVRDVYDLGDQLLLVSTDRISAFDHVLPNGIPDKGRVLTQLSAFWFDYLKVPNHMLSTEVKDFGLDEGIDTEQLVGRSMLVRKTKVVPIECVVRGYLSGSGWKEYQKSQSVCGIKLPAGLTESSKLPEPIFTPATKEENGHDINISFDEDRRPRSFRRAPRPQHRHLPPRGRLCRHPRHHHRRHEVRMGPRRRRADPDRRSPYARQLPVLAGRPIHPRPLAAQLRQAIRPRLARNDGLGQGNHPTKATRRRGQQHAGEVYRSVRARNETGVCLEVTSIA